MIELFRDPDAGDERLASELRRVGGRRQASEVVTVGFNARDVTAALNPRQGTETRRHTGALKNRF